MKKVVIGVLLLLFAIYIPISLFGSLSPFGSENRDLYVYEFIPSLLNELPGSIELKDISNTGVTVSSYGQIQDPEYYGLELTRKTMDYEDNFWYYPTVGIFILCFTCGVVLISAGATRRLERSI